MLDKSLIEQDKRLKRIKTNRFGYWWNLGVVHTKGRLLGYCVCLFVSGLIVGLMILLTVQSYQLRALRDIPVNLRGVSNVS